MELGFEFQSGAARSESRTDRSGRRTLRLADESQTRTKAEALYTDLKRDALAMQKVFE